MTRPGAGASATVTTPSDREIRIERTSKPRATGSSRVYTDPELIPRVVGPARHTTTVDQMDVRDGGSWRFVIAGLRRRETGFRGTYREVTPPERIVQTFEWEGMPGHVCVETATFEDLGDRTNKVTTSMFHTTRGARRHARLRHGERLERDVRAPRRAARAARGSLSAITGNRSARAASGVRAPTVCSWRAGTTCGGWRSRCRRPPRRRRAAAGRGGSRQVLRLGAATAPRRPRGAR